METHGHLLKGLQPSIGKIMDSVLFWDSMGVILIGYLDRSSTITGKYYADLITQLRRVINDKLQGKLKQRVLFLNDNAHVHKARAVQDRIHECGFQHFNNPPYSLDLLL